MALKGKPIAIGTSATTIYTCPAGVESAVHGLIFSNNSASPLVVTVQVFNQADNTTTTVATNLSVPANSYITWTKPVNMNAGDTISALASASGIVCLFSVYEGSAAPVAIGFTGRGIWASGSSYSTNDIVTVAGSGTYLALQASVGQNPTSASAYWMFLEGISASALPSQSGQAGKFLTTDGTDASWAVVDVAGGAEITNPMTTNVTLTTASKRVQVFTPTVGGLEITLPNTSSLSQGDSFSLQNKSAAAGILVKSASGSIIAFISAGKILKLFVANSGTNDWEGTITDGVSGVAVNFLTPTQGYSGTNFGNSSIDKTATNTYNLWFGRDSHYHSFRTVQVSPSGDAYSLLAESTIYLEDTTGQAGYYDNDGVKSNYIQLADNIYAASYTNLGNWDGTRYDHFTETAIYEITGGNTITRRHRASHFTGAKHGWATGVALLSNRRFLLCAGHQHGLSTATGPRVKVIDASSSLTSPSIGGETTLAFGSVRSSRVLAVERLEDNKGIIVGGAKPTNDDVLNTSLKVAVYTVSGTTVSIGTVYDVDSTAFFASNATSGRLQVVSLSATTAVVLWQSIDGNFYARYMTIAGTNITFGDRTRVTTFSSSPFAANKINSTQFALVCINPLDLNKHYVSIIDATPSGISTVSQSRFTDFSGYFGSYISGLYDDAKSAQLNITGTTGTSYFSQGVISSI